MATIKTKYNEGDMVYHIDKKGELREKKVMGIRTQVLNGKQKTNYSFLKDYLLKGDRDYLEQEPVGLMADDFYWLPEDKVYKDKTELQEKWK